MDLLTRVDLFNIGASYASQTTSKLSPTQAYTLGSDSNMFVGSQSVVGDAVVKQLGYNINRLLLNGAYGDDLDRYALDRYSLLRKGASAALGSVRIYRSTLVGGAGSVPIGTQLQSLTNAVYTTTSIAAFGPGDYTSKATVRAAQAGKSSQVGQNAITQFLQPNTLFDQTLQVNNDLGTAGGENVEDDETFRNRIRDFWNTASKGTIGAIQFGALSVPGVVTAMAQEVLTGGGLPARVVYLYIADSSGIASQELAAIVASALSNYRAAGISVLIVTSIPQLISIQLALSYAAGVDTVTLQNQVQAAVYSLVNSLGVNETLRVSDLNTVLTRFKGSGVIVSTPGSIIAPAGDLVPSIGGTLRTTLQNVQVESL